MSIPSRFRIMSTTWGTWAKCSTQTQHPPILWNTQLVPEYQDWKYSDGKIINIGSGLPVFRRGINLHCGEYDFPNDWCFEPAGDSSFRIVVPGEDLAWCMIDNKAHDNVVLLPYKFGGYPGHLFRLEAGKDD